jgi:hypothetical protein
MRHSSFGCHAAVDDVAPRFKQRKKKYNTTNAVVTSIMYHGLVATSRLATWHLDSVSEKEGEGEGSCSPGPAEVVCRLVASSPIASWHLKLVVEMNGGGRGPSLSNKCLLLGCHVALSDMAPTILVRNEKRGEGSVLTK